MKVCEIFTTQLILYLKCERVGGSWKAAKYSQLNWFYTWNMKGLKEVERLGLEINVLCLVDQDHQKWVIAVDYNNKFKAIYSIVNPSVMV